MRELDDSDEKWLALAEGRLSPEEREKLELEAKESPEDARKFEAYSPIDEGVARQMAASLDGNPVRRQRVRRWIVSGSALAASFAIFLGSRPEAEDPLPAFTASVRVGDAVERGSALETRGLSELPSTRADSTIEVLLRPASEATRQPRVVVWIQSERGRFASPVSAEVADNGAIRLRGEVGAIAAADHGPVSVVLVVASSPEADMERIAAEMLSLEADGMRRSQTGPSWQAIRVDALIRAVEEPR
ncbi:MAG: hypothetical protein AAGD10_08370 [Myxococcota bacterium]